MEDADIAQGLAARSQVVLPLRIQIVSDVRFTREALSELLPRCGLLLVSGSFAGLEDALIGIREGRPHLVLLDESFPDGREVIGRIRGAAPQVPVVVMAITETAEDVVAWAEFGASGYIPKTAALADVAPSLLKIVSGRLPCAESVAAGLMRRLSVVGPPAGEMKSLAPSQLTTREREIARLVAGGLSNKEIARRLDIGLATTKTHVHHLLGKLNLQRRGQAAGWLRDHSDL